MKFVNTLLFILGCLALSMILHGCAVHSDPWREQVRQPLDTGSFAWWDRVKAGR